MMWNLKWWTLTVWCATLSSLGQCQYLSRLELAPATQAHDDGSSGWDIRLAVPGEPGRDYPVLSSIPKTGFSCAGKKAGYYADVETNCQVFRVCTIGATYGFQSFLCPNGTLFNQQVFVCDWWMNVNCERSQKYYTENNEKFGNLKLGSSMIQDIKKMLTYSMNNPYKNNINNNQLIMQVYIPPDGQPFSNGGYLAEKLRNPEYATASQLQLPLNSNGNGYSENLFSGSTPSPQYVPTINHPANLIAANEQLFQLNNGQYNMQTGQYVNLQSNGGYNKENAQFGQLRNEISNPYPRLQNDQSLNVQNGRYTNGHVQNAQYSQSQNPPYNSENAQYQNSQRYQFSNSQSFSNQPQGDYNSNGFQSGKLIDSNVNGQYNNGQQKTPNGTPHELQITFTKQQYTYPSQYDKQITYKIPSNQIVHNQQVTGEVGQFQEVKQNLVSDSSINRIPTNSGPLYSSPTIVAKTLTVNKEVKSGKIIASNNPTSRLTFKTWTVQPSKTARIIAKSDGYKYERPKPSRQYLTPTTPRPVAAKIHLAPTTSKSTVASRLYLTPSRPTLSSRLYLAPTTARSTVSSRLYRAPSSQRPTLSARLYSAPVQSRPNVSARLIAPPSSQQPIYNRNNYASASTVTPVYLSPIKNDNINHSVTITKHSHINTNHNNLTFTDILTKEKLDITVNDIVKDTSHVLKENSASKLSQLREKVGDEGYSDSVPQYLPAQISSSRSDNITTVLPSSTLANSHSARLTKDPSNSLELPIETFKNDHPKVNQIASLPYYKPRSSQPEITTTDRTVSLKISLPERTAQFILKYKNESELDHLEILNTGSSNYLVLTNNGHSSNKTRNFIPLGKLVVDKNANLSNPQAYVYDFLAGSIDAAKTYEKAIDENVKKFNLVTNTCGQQFQNIDAQDLNDISEKISQLTMAQYKNNFSNKQEPRSNLVPTAQTTTQEGNIYRGTTKFVNGISQTNQPGTQIQNSQVQTQQNNEVNGNYYSSNFYNSNSGTSAKLQVASEANRAGRLYQVPNNIVTQNINQLSSNHADYIHSNSQNELAELNEFQQNGNIPNGENKLNRPSELDEVELVETGVQQNGSPAKLQVAPSTVSSQISNTINNIPSRGAVEDRSNGNAIGAQIYKQITVNHPLSDNNLVTYKADKSFYIFTKYAGSGNAAIPSIGFNQLGEIRNQNAAYINEESNKPREILTTVQFIPSLSFQLDDEDDQQKLIKVLHSQEAKSGDNKYGTENGRQGYGQFSQNVESVPTSSVDYAVQHTVPTKLSQLQQYRSSPENLYAGPSSYSAPQASVGRLEHSQSGQLNVAPSPPTSSYVPARLEEFEDTAGYPRVTPAIPFSY